jgi:AcrR family transcriptional regulator
MQLPVSSQKYRPRYATFRDQLLVMESERSMRAQTKTMPRTKPPEVRRDDLMNAAEQLFLEQGITTTTIEQITLRAGVAKGTFYLYFTSKDDVLAALSERFAQQHLACIKTAVAQAPANDWKKTLATWARACATGYLDLIKLHDILFYGTRPSTREGLVDNIVIDHLVELLRAGVDAKAWSIDDPRFTAVFLFSGLHGVVDDAYSKEKQVNRKRLTQRLERLCLHAVETPFR